MRTLLVQTSFLGDALLSTPVVAGIHTLFPGTELWTLSTPLAQPIFSRDPLVHCALTFDKRHNDAGLTGVVALARKIRSSEFAHAFVLHRSWRSAFLMMLSRVPERIGFTESAFPLAYHRRVSRAGYAHDVQRNLAILSPYSHGKDLDSSLRLFPTAFEAMSDQVKARMKVRSGYVAVVPGSVWYTKRWAWERYRELCLKLDADGIPVVVLGAGSERETAERVVDGTRAVNLCGATSIEEFVCCMAHARGVVCNDSFALHVASALKKPTVAVFCATSPKFGFGPWGNPYAAVVEQDSLPCKPCSRHGGKRCPVGTNACMYEVGSDLVYKRLRTMLESKELRQPETTSEAVGESRFSERGE